MIHHKLLGKAIAVDFSPTLAWGGASMYSMISL